MLLTSFKTIIQIAKQVLQLSDIHEAPVLEGMHIFLYFNAWFYNKGIKMKMQIRPAIGTQKKKKKKSSMNLSGFI